MGHRPDSPGGARWLACRLHDPTNGRARRRSRARIVRGMSIAGASETSDEKRNRLGRGWLTAVTGIAGPSGRRESLARPAGRNRRPVRPLGTAGPSGRWEPPARPAGRVGMKGAGSVGEPGRRKDRRSEATRTAARPGRRATRGLSRRCCWCLCCSGAARGFSGQSRQWPMNHRGSTHNSRIRHYFDIQSTVTSKLEVLSLRYSK